MKHTLGPWKVAKHKDYGCYSIHIGDAPQEGEEIDNSVAGVWDISEEGLSNARLIASAPDLLEALERIIDRIKENKMESNFPSAFERAQQAIKKAKGL